MVIGHSRRGLALAAALSVLAAVPSCGHKSAAPAGQSQGSPATSMPGAAGPATTGPVVSPPSPIAQPGTTRWVDLKPGQCLAAPPPTDPAIVTVDVVDCSQPHSAEVFLRVNIPVDTALTGNANAQCETGLGQYTAGASAGGQYAITYLIDSDQDRTSNNPLPSTLICLLEGAQGQPLSRSAHG